MAGRKDGRTKDRSGYGRKTGRGRAAGTARGGATGEDGRSRRPVPPRRPGARPRLGGSAAGDQARRLDALLTHTTWTADTLLAAHTAPFEGLVRTSAGAVISARRTALSAAPTYVPEENETQRSAAAQETHRRVMAECTECGRPPEAGIDLCAEYAAWPLRPACHIYRTPDGAPCRHCADRHRHRPRGADRCTGHQNGPGRALATVGRYLPPRLPPQVTALRSRPAQATASVPGVRRWRRACGVPRGRARPGLR